MNLPAAIEAYKAQAEPMRQHLRNRAEYLANSPSADAMQRQVNMELLAAMNEAEKQLASAQPVQVIKFELPDISAGTAVKVGKYVAVVGGFWVGLYAIGAVVVGIAASITAFFAAYGVYVVGIGFVVLVLSSIDWGGNNDAETAETTTANQQNITINVTAANGGNVTVNKD